MQCSCLHLLNFLWLTLTGSIFLPSTLMVNNWHQPAALFNAIFFIFLSRSENSCNKWNVLKLLIGLFTCYDMLHTITLLILSKGYSPLVSGAHCGYTSLHKYVITIPCRTREKCSFDIDDALYVPSAPTFAAVFIMPLFAAWYDTTYILFVQKWGLIKVQKPLFVDLI